MVQFRAGEFYTLTKNMPKSVVFETVLFWKMVVALDC